MTIDLLRSCVEILDLSLNDDKVWMSHEWEIMIQCVSSVQRGVLRDLKSVLTAYAREAHSPLDTFYNPVHFIPLVSTPWYDNTLQTLAARWTGCVLKFQVRLNPCDSGVIWRRLCECALAQLTFEDLQSVSGELTGEKRRVRKGKIQLYNHIYSSNSYRLH